MESEEARQRNKKVRKWYMKKYPEDPEGRNIRKGLTFDQLYMALHKEKCVYHELQVYDSIVRERVFQKMSEVFGVDYGHIYGLWRDGMARELVRNGTV